MCEGYRGQGRGLMDSRPVHWLAVGDQQSADQAGIRCSAWFRMRGMAVITIPLLAQAERCIGDLDLQAKAARCDSIHACQPGLLYSVLVLQRYGASMLQIELVLDLLLVFDEAMRASGRSWQTITEDDQERCLKRVTGRIRFVEGLPSAQLAQAVTDNMETHPETPMLAMVFGKLRAAGQLGIETDAQKMLLLVALNLVECIADSAG